MRLLLGICAVFASAWLVAGAAPGSSDLRSSMCPGKALALGANGIGPASAAALGREEAKSRPQVREAIVAIDDLRGRGRAVKAQCGAAAAQRTIVVYITLRAFLPSASLSERVSYVSRFRSGWRVWQVAH